MADGMMNTEQIARLTHKTLLPPLDTVTAEELASALTEYEAYQATVWPTERLLPHIELARKLLMLIQATRNGETCIGCKMGEHPQ